MKNKSQLQKQFLSALVGLALSTSSAFSAPLITVDTYDSAPLPAGTWSWWGGATIALDATQDHTGNAGGSLYINHPVAGDSIMIAEYFSGNQWDTGKTYDLTTYTNLSLWLKWDSTNSTMSISDFNNTGSGFEMILNDSANGQWGSNGDANRHYLPKAVIPDAASNGWVHLNFPISSSIPYINLIGGIEIHAWENAPWSGVVAFWVDDITLQPGAVEVIPPPIMSFHPVTCRGLQLYASASADRWQRQMIRTLDTTFSWVGASYPMSYCWKICNFSPCVLNVIQTFDTGMSWENWWGLGGPSWDSGTDRWTNSASGSMKLVAPFTGASSEQFCYRWLSSLNGNQYGSLQFDIKVDPSSGPGSSGDYGSWEFGFVNASYGTTPIGSTNITGLATNGWVHINLPIEPSATYDATALGLYMKYWCDGYLTNTLTCWIDNLVLYAANEQMHVLFVPLGESYTNLPYGWGDSSLDWNCRSLLFLRIQQENLAPATNLAAFYPGYICRIGFKTNQPSGNSMIFNDEPTNGPVGLLCVMSNDVVLGDWCLTFTSATDFTLTAPGGASASGTIPSDVAQNVFNDSMGLYFGHQPNSRANIFLDAASQTLTLNRIWITNSGVGTRIDDSFGAPPLDTNIWATCAADATTIWIVPTNARWIVDWSVPASGFMLTTTANVVDTNSWVDLPAETARAIQPTTQKLTWIADGLPSHDLGFFGMVKRTASKLQVLLPGETSAPGTLTGKSGSPTPVATGSIVDFTVNACDSTWHVVPGVTDTIHITSSDGGAILPLDAGLANGTRTFQIQLNTAGPQTVTATDVTNGAIAPDTSSQITVTE